MLALAVIRRAGARAAAVRRLAPVGSRARFATLDADSDADFLPKSKAPPAAAPVAAAAAEGNKAMFPAIEAVIKAHPVVLFMKGTPSAPQCGFSAQTVRVLASYPSARVHGVNVLADDRLRAALKDFSAWPTFPQLYVGGEFVGGCDIATAMHAAGELKPLIEKATGGAGAGAGAAAGKA